MTITNFTSLDFEDIKDTIKRYIRADSRFTDYDYEGSTLSLVIDMLAYNTYISAYNANMLSNEVFLDSATLRENVVSLARNIGYLPRPRKSAKAEITFFVDTSELPVLPRSLTLRKGIVAINASKYVNKNLTFCIPDDITSIIKNDRANFNIHVYEGALVTQRFTVDEFDVNQRFILDNSGIDYSTLRVNVYDDAFTDDKVVYNLATSITEINGSSNVYFLQEIPDERYELIFGDGIFGSKLENGNVIEVSYIVSNGEDGNGANVFRFTGNLIDNNGSIIDRDVSIIQTLSPASGGLNIESVKSIKNYAGRIYASQNRAVTADDYESIVRKIYPEVDSISAFGGEELDPPRFGKVFITIKPQNGLYVSNSLKDSIKRELRKYSVAGIVPEILDTKYLFIECDTSVYYNSNLTGASSSVRQKVINTLNKFANSDEMNMYGSRFKYTQFTSLIDKSDQSITSNITEIRIRRDMRSILNRLTEYEICFGNRFKILNQNGYNIKSSAFRVSGISKTVFFSDIPSGDGETGELVLITVQDPPPNLGFIGDYQIEYPSANIVRRRVGTVDYMKGEIKINAINIVSTEFIQNSIIQISACPNSNDVIGLQDLFLQFDVNYSSVQAILDNISSGSDPTGSRYISTPSYSNKNIIRLVENTLS